ncbi:MAG: LysM peptidoglycan-binding domain-containing protein [Rhodospirillales bacterium]|nr:LysM peptidoglycan-binding domain-containing protein [Rhodospirillales bacterium]
MKFITIHNLPAKFFGKSLRENTVNLPIKMHTIAEKETLSSIAKKFTKSSENWPLIWYINRKNINDPNMISKNIKIKVPTKVESWRVKKVATSSWCSQILKNKVQCMEPVFAPSEGLKTSIPIGQGLLKK